MKLDEIEIGARIRKIREEEKMYNEPPIDYSEFIEDEEYDYSDIIRINEETDEIIKPKSREEAISWTKEEYRKLMEEFENRSEFNSKEVETEFREQYINSLTVPNDYYPKFVYEEVDKRRLALNLIPKKTYKALKKHEKENNKKFKRIEKEAEKELSKQNVEEMYNWLFSGFHDGDIKEIRKNGNDVFLYVHPEYSDEQMLIELKNGEFIENEVEDYLKNRKSMDDNYCRWLYHKLYKNNKYELYILADIDDERKYITIRCDEIFSKETER